MADAMSNEVSWRPLAQVRLENESRYVQYNTMRCRFFGNGLVAGFIPWIFYMHNVYKYTVDTSGIIL